MPPPVRVLYVAGVGRSGSTLLSQMLGSLDGFAAVGELHHFWRTGVAQLSPIELCGCGAPYASCPLWQPVVDSLGGPLEPRQLAAAQRLKKSVDRTRFIPWMVSRRRPAGFERRLRRHAGAVERLYEAVRRVSGARTIVDDSKDVSSAYLLSLIPAVEVWVVHLVRDSRGVVHSWNDTRRRTDFLEGSPLMPRKPPLQAAGYWLYSNLLVDLGRGRSRGYLRVRYEDLVRRPRATIAGICDLLGETSQDLGFLSGAEVRLRRPSHILHGNPAKLAGPAIRLRADERWRSGLSAGQRLAVTALTAPLLRRYGYFGRPQPAGGESR